MKFLDDKLKERVDAYVRDNRITKSPVWNSRLCSDDLAAARALAKSSPTYENLVIEQRLERVANEAAKKHRAAFKIIGDH